MRHGNSAATQELFERYRQRLRRLVELRLNRRLQGRIDPSDVVQDALLQAAKGLQDYVRQPRLPVYLWLRILTQQQLLEVHRHHLRTGKRDATREVAMDAGDPGASSACLAAEIVAATPTPSEQAQKTEQQRLLEEAIDAMEPMDREILALRHFEQLSNSEVACLLEIGETAASQRFFRALKRLRQKMQELGIPDLQ